MKLIKKIDKNYIYATIIPIIFYLLICLLKGVFIFGDYTFAIRDAYHQYVPFQH